MTVGIYYATTTGKTEDVADRLHNFISSAEAPKDVSDVDDLSEFEGLDGIICGIPTWNTCLLYTSPSPRDVEESPKPKIATFLPDKLSSPISSKIESHAVPDLSSSAPVFQVGIPQIIPSRPSNSERSSTSVSYTHLTLPTKA